MEEFPDLDSFGLSDEDLNLDKIIQDLDNAMNCPLMEKNISITESNSPIESAIESSRDDSPARMYPDIAGESSTTDFPDFGLPPGFMTGEPPPWESILEASTPQGREKAKLRYYEKKKNRRYGKQIRYECRKARTATRKRVKGRFVKASEEFDHDPGEEKNC